MNPLNLTLLLSGIIPFEGMGESELGKLASEGREVSFQKGEYLYGVGKPANQFFVVMEGKIKLNVRKGKTVRTLGILTQGEFFGEDLLVGTKRISSAKGLESGKVFTIGRKSLTHYLKNHPDAQKLLHLTASSRKIASKRSMKWLGTDEVIYVITRRHPFRLSLQLILPSLLLLVALGLLGFGFVEPSFFGMGMLMGLLLGVGGLAWLIWRIVDWTNDFYVISNRRVIWIEKIVALYDSRHEAPLEQIQSADQIFNPVLRRFIDYAKVIVNTYTGSITMDWAWHPQEVVRYTNALRDRSRRYAKQMSMEAMEVVISQRLGYANPGTPIAAAHKPAAPKKKKIAQLRWFANSLKLRYQEGDIITYRKHWYILIKKIWFQSFLLILLSMLAIYIYGSGIWAELLISCAWGGLFLGAFTWWLYSYVDWRNDIYVLTLDKILDIKRTPLTRESKREATLDRILSTETQRVGIVPLLLNVGNVIINIGTEQFSFEGVFNPNGVQYEINERRNAAKKRKEEADTARERERVADWLVAYHNQTTKLENLENGTQSGGNSG